MKVLFNASNLHKGGALQIAVFYMLQSLKDSQGIDWAYVLSEACARKVSCFGPLPPCTEVVSRSPARSWSIRNQLFAIESKHRPEVVYSPYGPDYVRFRAHRIVGCCEPWVTHPSLAAYRTLRFPVQWLTHKLASRYKARWFRSADAWTTETETARQGMCTRLGLRLDRILVNPNSCGEHYLQRQSAKPFPESDKRVRILSFTAAYPHKNLVLLPDVASRLRSLAPQLDFELVITLPDKEPTLTLIKSRAKQLNVADRIVNRGPIAVADGPSLYESCDICFLPTVLETFSATYPEAMAMGLPIVTTDLDFAHDVCQDAAVFFQPFDADDAARQILRLVKDQRLWNTLVTNGHRIFRSLPTARERYLAVANFLKRVGASSQTAA